MKIYGVYTFKDGVYQRNLMTRSYHSCFDRANELIAVGKDCIIVSGEQKDFKREITGDEPELTIELSVFGGLSGN